MAPSCIDEFIICDCDFVILENRMFTLSNGLCSPVGNFFSSGLITQTFEESEEFRNLEFECYESNAKLFFDSITKDIKQQKKGLKNLNNIFSILQEKNNEKIILYNTIRDYLNLYSSKESKNSKEKISDPLLDNKSDNIYIPKLDELKTIKPLIEKLYNSSGLLFKNRKVYDIIKGKYDSDLIHFKGKDYFLEFKCNSDDFLSTYKKIIKDHIITKFKNKNQSIDESMKQIEAHKNILNSEISKIKKSINISKSGEIGYEKKKNHYEVFVDIPKFIYKHDNNHYLFDKTRVAINVIFSDNSAILTKKPYIPKEFMSYNHPFVYSGGSICLGNSYFIKGRLEDKNIFFNRKYYFKKHNISKRIAVCLHEAKQVIEDGYIGDLTPVKRLNRSNFGDEFLAGGIYDSRAKQISKDRIFPKVSK